MSVQSCGNGTNLWLQSLLLAHAVSTDTTVPVEIPISKHLDVKDLNIRIKNITTRALKASVFQSGPRTYLSVRGPLNLAAIEISEFVRQATQQIFYIYKDQLTLDELFALYTAGCSSSSEEGKGDEPGEVEVKKYLSDNQNTYFQVKICAPDRSLPEIIDGP